MIGELISAGAGLLGSLFGNKKPKNQTVTTNSNSQSQTQSNQTSTVQQGPIVSMNTVDYASMVADAEASGFNPLTVLRNGGSAGYSTSVTLPSMSQTTTSGMQSTASVGQDVQTTSGGSSGANPLGAVFDAVGRVGDIFASYDPMKAKREEMEFQIQKEQLRRLQNKDRQAIDDYIKQYGVPSISGQASHDGMRGTPGVHLSQKDMDNTIAKAAGAKLMEVEAQAATATNPWASLGFSVDPNASDGDGYETRYGDFLGGVLGGIVPAMQDARHNIDRYYRDYRQAAKQQGAAALTKKWLDSFGGPVGGYSDSWTNPGSW